MGTMDPTFNPVITDDSAAFSEQAVAAMEKELSKLQLTDSYQLLEKIVNYKDSPACKEKQQCSLVDGKNTFSAKYQQEPGVSGPLKVGNSLVDAFTLQYYEGFPMDQVARGEIKSDQQWKVLSKLKNGYQTACLPHRKWRAMLRNRWSVISTKLWSPIAPAHRKLQCWLGTTPTLPLC